jgi:hypothetical protein
MAMVVSDDFVGLEIPAFHHLKSPDARVNALGLLRLQREILKEKAHLVLTTREKVRVAGRYCQPAHRGDMTGERQAQLAGRQIPNLDDAVPCTGCKPLVSRLDSNAAHPTQVARNNAHELPRCMVCGLDGAGSFV